MKILVIVSYKGTNYFGWQRQPKDISVQEIIESKLSQFFNRKITIYGAGRTDAGVHAEGQCFHFSINEEKYDLDRFKYSLNMMLPDDIKFVDCKEVDEDFHARFSAKDKEYIYKITLASKDPFLDEVSYVYAGKFDIVSFKETLTHFIGEHNFKNFTSKPQDADNFVRNIYSISVEEKSNQIITSLIGNGFMQYMVRDIIGTALAVASGKITLDAVIKLLSSDSERHIVSFKAPPQGLYLKKVNYYFN